MMYLNEREELFLVLAAALFLTVCLGALYLSVGLVNKKDRESEHFKQKDNF
jgi:hypothetical protein